MSNTTTKILHMFNNGKEIYAGLPFAPGMPLRLHGELAARLDAQTTSVDLLTRGFCTGTIVSRINLEQEPERGSCLLTVLDSRESGDLLLNFAVACAETALVRRAGGAYYKASATAISAIQGRRKQMAAQLTTAALQALSAAAAKLGKPYNGAMPGTPYYSMYSADADCMEYFNKLAAAIADTTVPVEKLAARVATLAQCDAGKFVEALAWLRRAENSQESYGDISAELGGEMSMGERLSRAATRGTPRFAPNEEYKKGASRELADQNALLERLLSN